MEITVVNRQRRVRFDLRWLRLLAALALDKCRERSADGSFALGTLPEVLVVVVSDAAIARLHWQFMHIAGPTDVITFQHGEIVISAETAQVKARELGCAVEKELALYTVHGLLHLNGFEDRTPRGAARMRSVQTHVLKTCLLHLHDQ